MRRSGSALAILAVGAVAIGGCGTKEKKADRVVVADPVAEALGHAPAGAAALAVVATDPVDGPGAALVALAQRFPGVQLVAGQAQATLSQRVGLDFATEIRPLLGNPLVLWSPDGSGRRLFSSWVVRNGDLLGKTLDARVKDGRLEKGAAVGDYALYTRSGGGAYARRGPVLLSGPDVASVTALLRRRGGGWTRALLRQRGLGLPLGGVAAQVALDARVLVARDAGRARSVPWVAALRRAAVTVAAGGDGLHVRVRATTDATGLTAVDLPLAAGAAPPIARGNDRIVAAVRDPRQTVVFARKALEQLDPGALKGLGDAEALLGRYAGISVDKDILDQLSGTATLTTRDGTAFTLRSDLADPGRVSDALGRLGRLAKFGGPLAHLAGVDLGGFDVDESDGRYSITKDGKLVVALKVVDGVLVASTDDSTDLDAAASAPAGSAAPASGAFRATVDPELVKDVLIARLGLPEIARAALTPLGRPVITARGERGTLDAQLLVPVEG